MTVKCDLHVHSKYSSKPTNWLTRQFKIPECHTEPLYIYETAIKKGMTHVTITDHDTISGCLEIAHLLNTFVSCEVTAEFPEDQCMVHILVYDITEQQFNEIAAVRKNIYELLCYLNGNGIWHAVAHPLYSVNNRMTQQHLEKLLVSTNLFEQNGFRSKAVNEKMKHILDALSDRKLAELAEKHSLTFSLTSAEHKAVVCGSDDHSGLYIARSHTTNPGSTIADFFTNARKNKPCLQSAEPSDLGYAFYSIIYKAIESRMDIAKYAQMDDALKNISAIMTMQESDSGSPFHSMVRWVMRHSPVKKGDVESQLKNMFREISVSTDTSSVEEASRQWFGLISRATNESVRDLLEYITEQVKSGNIFNIFRTIGSISALYFLSIPYYVSYRVFQETRHFADTIDIAGNPCRLPKVAHFTDTYYEVNGVALTLRQMMQSARRLGLDYTFITSDTKSSLFGEKVFKPVTMCGLPEYPELRLVFPPLLEVLDYIYQGNFTHIHSATPGTMGLVGLFLAKFLKKPFYTTYHTAVPQYAGKLTGDGRVEEFIWKYIRWFYRMSDKVFVPSHAFIEELVENGISRDKICLMPRGIDTERFSYKNGNGDHSGYRLLYVGRISKEKNLDVLASAFVALNRPDVSLILVGDGPYRSELQEQLRGYNVEFPGYLMGDSLVEMYHTSDLFVFPSTTDTFGNVILEAHSCGLPTITTDVGGPCENVIDGETGIIVRGNDIAALQEAIEALLDREKLTEMGKRARELVEHRTFEKAFQKFWNCYRNEYQDRSILWK